jgi:hypothetical protein
MLDFLVDKAPFGAVDLSWCLEMDEIHQCLRDDDKDGALDCLVGITLTLSSVIEELGLDREHQDRLGCLCDRLYGLSYRDTYTQRIEIK